MSDSPFKTFIQLASFDHEIGQLRAQELAVRHELQGTKKQETVMLAEVDAAKQACLQAQQEVARHELLVEELAQQETEKKRRLESVTGHKEYTSLKTELDHIHAQQQALETELLQAWSSVESAARRYEHKKVHVEKQLHEVVLKRNEFIKQQQDLEEKLRNWLERRKVQQDAVPSEWLEKYQAMLSRVADPVVPVAYGSCSACFYKISEQDLLMLARNKLLQCKDCYRFLYLPDRV